jgi:excisionase family DNA binding protein
METHSTHRAAPPEAKAYTVPQVCKMLQCSKSTAYELLKSGQLKRLKIGKKTLVPADSIYALLESAK